MGQRSEYTPSRWGVCDPLSVMRAIQLLAVIALAGIVVAGASAIESTIVPGVGIGKVRLGMTRAQVEGILGKDAIVNDRAMVGNTSYVELGWDYSSWSIGFLRKGRTLRVVEVGTSRYSQRTRKGIGIGSGWHKTIATYPGGACSLGGTFSPSGHPVALNPEYLIGQRGGTQVLFQFSAGEAPPKIIQVRVRQTFRPLPEFRSDWDYRCRIDWRTASRP
jgi:hypothetical protein